MHIYIICAPARIHTRPYCLIYILYSNYIRLLSVLREYRYIRCLLSVLYGSLLFIACIPLLLVMSVVWYLLLYDIRLFSGLYVATVVIDAYYIGGLLRGILLSKVNDRSLSTDSYYIGGCAPALRLSASLLLGNHQRRHRHRHQQQRTRQRIRQEPARQAGRRA